MHARPPVRILEAGREWILLGALTLGGFLLRLAFRSSFATAGPDAAAHAALARALSGGPSLAPVPPPGTALFIWPWQGLTDGLTAGRDVSLIAGTLLVPAVYFLARSLGGGAWAFVPALAVAILPPFVGASLTPGPEALFPLLVVLALVSARRGWDFLGGVVIGLACLVRPEALFLTILGAILLRRPRRAGRWLLGAGLVALPALLVVGLTTGQWGWADAHAPFFGPRWWSGPSRFDALPYLALLGAALAALLARIRAVALRRAAGWALVVGAIAVAGLGRASYRAEVSEQSLELAKAGQWLRSRIGSGALVMAPGLLAAYHADAAYLPIPQDSTYDEILDEVVERKADFLIVDSEALVAAGSALAPLSLDKPVAWHEVRLRPVYMRIRDEEKEKITLIFRVVRPGGPPPLSGEENMKGGIGSMNHTENHFFHGILARRAKAYWVAAGEFDYAVRAEELHAEGHHLLAVCLLEAEQDYARALDHARTSVLLDEDNREYVATLIETLRRLGQDAEAATWEAKLAHGLPSGAAPEQPAPSSP